MNTRVKLERTLSTRPRLTLRNVMRSENTVVFSGQHTGELESNDHCSHVCNPANSQAND